MSSIYSSDKILTGPHSTSLGGNTKMYESVGGKKNRKSKKRRSLKKKRVSRKKRFFFF